MKALPVHWQLVELIRHRIYTTMLLSATVVLLWMASLTVTAFLLARVLTGRPSAGLAVLPTGLVLMSYLLWIQSFKRSHFAAFELEKVPRLKLAERIGHAPPGLAVNSDAAALAQVTQNDVTALHTFMISSTSLYARLFATPLFAFLILLPFDWRLASATAAVLAAGVDVLLSMTEKG